MDAFTARNALLTGALLIRRRPLLVLTWAAVLLAQAIVYSVAAREFAAIARAGIFSGRPAPSYNGQAMGLTLANLVVSLVIGSMLWCSAFRAILRPTDRPPLAFGSEELSVLAVRCITQVVPFVVLTPLQILIIGRFRNLSPGVLVTLFAAVSVLGLFWSAVASVWTFGQGQIAPFRCWTIARGRFWLLAGLIVGVAVLDQFVGVGVRQLTTALSHLLPVDRASPTEPFGVAGPRVQDAFQLPALLQHVLMTAASALEIAFVAGIVSSAYRARLQEPQAAAAFSSVVSGAS